MAGKVITFINMKGGVGKTTLCIGIGEFLAHNKNKKILFIDLDPQFNTTQSLMNEFDREDEYLNSFYPKNITVKKILASITSISQNYEIPKAKEVIIELDENIHIIAGTIDLILEDNNKDITKTKKIKKFIHENNLKNIYDFIFIDCPPTISLYTDAALLATDFYVVPNRIDRYSILGIKHLKQVIDKIKYDEELNIMPLGIVYTMVNEPITQKSINLKNELEKTEFVKEIGLFKNNTTFVQDLLVGLQGNISSHYLKSRNEIESVSNEFLKRIDDYDKSHGSGK